VSPTLELVKPAATAPEPFVDSDAAAKHLGVSDKTIRNLAAAGRIPGTNLGTGKRALWRFKISELDTHMAKNSGRAQ
jgi:excisionase family DNA binding protein